MNRKLLILLLIMLMIIPISSASVWDYLTKGRADSLYCIREGDCVLNNLTVENILNATYATVIINSTLISGENWVNESGDTMTGDLTLGSVADIDFVWRGGDALIEHLFSAAYLQRIKFRGNARQLVLESVTGDGAGGDIILTPDSSVGGVGIGTSDPNVTLHVVGTADVDELRLEDNQYFYLGTAQDIQIYYNGVDTIFNQAIGSNWFNFTGGSGISTDGEIVAGLDLRAEGDNVWFGSDNEVFLERTSANDLVSQSAHFQSQFGLYVRQGDGNRVWGIDADVAGADAGLQLIASGEKVRILNTGEVGIGTTTPESTLDIVGNGTASGNFTADNIFKLAYISSHTNDTIPVAVGGVWYNVTFDHEESTPKKRIDHIYNDATNDTFTINDDGVYEVSYFLEFEDSAASPSAHILARVIVNGIEMEGTLLEEDSTKQNADVVISHGGDLARLSVGDEIKLQFTSDDASVSLITHQTFGTHKDTAHIGIIRVDD